MKTYTVRVTETYISDFAIEAESEDEAREKAEAVAADDFNLTAPENMTTRDLEIVGVEDDTAKPEFKPLDAAMWENGRKPNGER